MSDETTRLAAALEVNPEAGDYFEDEGPLAWDAWVNVVKTYSARFAGLSASIGEDGAASVLAGTMLSYLADQHCLFLRREPNR